MASRRKLVIPSLVFCSVAVAHSVSAAELTAEMAEPLPAAVEGENYNSPLVINSSSREPVTFSLVNGPRGLRISRGGRVSWQPDYDVAGDYPIVFTVSNDQFSTTLQTSLKVKNTNRQPNFTSRPLSGVAEGQTYRYPYNAVDPDHEEVTVTVAKKPAGMTVQDNSLVWQTGYDDAGTYDIELVASDGDMAVRQSYTLVVQNINRNPVIQKDLPESVSIDEDSRWSLPVNVTDPDGDKISLTIDGAPAGMALSGNTIKWQPGFEQAGDYTITVNASDGENTTSANILITVNDINRLPQFISQPETELTETDMFTYELRAFDADQPYLQYQLLEGPEQMQLNDSTLSWQTGYDDAGVHPVKVSVTDGSATVTQAFDLKVDNKNRPPEFRSEPVKQIDENQVFSYTIDAVDPDGGPLEISVPELPEQIKRDGNTLSWQTDFKSAGSYPIRIVAKDDESETEQSFVLDVNNINHKPVFTSQPPLKAVEAIDYRYALSATDSDNEELTFSLKKAPEGMQIINDKALWRPRFGQAGSHDITIAVTDGIDTVTQSFTVKVANTNREPVLFAIEDQQVKVGDKFKYELEASDPEGEDVKLDLVRHPDGMRLKRNEISWHPDEDDVGSYTIIVSASDGDLIVRKHFVLEVLPQGDK